MKGPHLRFYDIHGIIGVRSERRLPELEFFACTEPPDEIDIDVRIAADPQRHKQRDSIVYEDWLGRLGFSIVITRRDDRTTITASPLVGGSPHVLYTNVLEPVLRWLLVRKGHALMHGACLAADGRALFITAQTDTGKTTTILYALRHQNNGLSFLSDDMTIFSPDGTVSAYPKPLTISQHTVQAMGGAPLTAQEKRKLKVQSRLHSRGGRRVGMWLDRVRTPAATMNAVVQWLIPPPKFMVHRLVPGTPYGRQAELAHLVLIERGEALREAIPEREWVDILVANADDAYGFPPYPALADALSHWQGADLHDAERALVAATIRGRPGIRLRCDDYSWYQHLPGLLRSTATRPTPPRVVAATGRSADEATAFSPGD